MQIIDESFTKSAENNSRRVKTIYPSRGLIYDRKGRLLVDNQPAYDIIVTPNKMREFDTLELLSILDIEKDKLDESIRRCKRYSRYKSSILISEITADKYAILQEKLHKYHGFDIQRRTIRRYSVETGADVFGYVGEVSNAKLRADTSYSRGDYIGKTGVEKSYDKILGGKKGIQMFLVDNLNRVQGSYKDGLYDRDVQVGKSINLTIDMDLQEYAYKLMNNKKGAIVAIEPATGEILLKVTSPTYAPKLMVGIQRGKNYGILEKTPGIPLFDRAIMASYPPGSTFKIIEALIALQEDVINPYTSFPCSYGYDFGPFYMKCHHHHSPIALREAIQESCNPYFVQIFRKIMTNKKYKNVREAYSKWYEYVESFGLGQKICPDFGNEFRGNIPSQKYYDNLINSKRWHWMRIMSLSIGQGELLITPMQMANMTAIIANKGYYINPHIVKGEDTINSKIRKHIVPIDKKHFDTVLNGMYDVISKGTGKNAAVKGISICGKTGTVQNPRGPAHSVFIALAPRNNPKIAIAVYIENGEWGSRFAAPITGLLIEKYLNGKIAESRKEMEEMLINSNLMNLEGKRNE